MQRGRTKFLKRPWANARLKFFLSGHKPPRLGSAQDYVIQAFINKEYEREVLVNKLITKQVLLGVAQESQGEIIADWNRYVALSYGVDPGDQAKIMTESYLQREYEKYRNIDVKMRIKPDGKSLEISGISDRDMRTASEIKK